MNKLTKEEAEWVSHETMEEELRISKIEKAKTFKIGDYLILSEYDELTKITKVEFNSYGVPSKFKVVFVSSAGFPYVKRINSKSNPVGELISIVTGEGYFGEMEFSNCRWDLDPDYADSIILQDEEGYDPAGQSKLKRDIYKQITAYNRQCKVNTKTMLDVDLFLKTLIVHQPLWVSFKTKHTVVAIRQEPYSKSKHMWNQRTKSGFVTTVTLADHKGKEKTINAMDFVGKALYCKQPRSYKELKEPKF
jgi:hypothetical protein